MKQNSSRATVAALAAQVIFGFSFLFTKIALKSASPAVLLADRYIIAFLVMTFVIVFTKKKINFSANLWKLLLMALFQPVMYFLFETYGIQLTTSSFSSVMIAMIPVVSMFFGIFMLQEIPSVMQYVFTALSVAGVILMAGIGSSDGTVTPIGILLLSGAVLSSVIYNALSRKLSNEFSALERTYAMMTVGAIAFFGIALTENIGNPIAIFLPFQNLEFLCGVGYLGIISSVVAFFLMNYANAHLPISKTTVFSNFTMVVSVVAGVVFLGESFSLSSLIAIVMIVIGVWGVQLQRVGKK